MEESSRAFDVNVGEYEHLNISDPIRVEKQGMALEISADDFVAAAMQQNYGLERVLSAVVKVAEEDDRPKVRKAGEVIKGLFRD